MSIKRKRALFIINPKAGGKDKSGFEKFAANYIDTQVIDAEFVFTKGPNHATEISLKAKNEGYDFVIAVGGDGTMNEVAQSLLYSETIFGIIPYGSGNGLGRTLGIPMDTGKAISLINKGNYKQIDSGKLNDRHFFNVAGLGIDAYVAGLFADSKSRGFVNYIKSSLKAVFSYKAQHYTIKTDKETIKTKAIILSIANSNQYGNNAYIAPDAKTDDGLLNICIVKNFNIFTLPVLVYRLFAKNIHISSAYIGLKTEKCTISREKEAPVHIDGEPMNDTNTITVEVLKNSLKILVP